MRTRQKESDRLYEMKIDVLNKKISNLVKEVASLSRSAKRVKGDGGGGAKDKEVVKDSGGSGTESPVTN